MLIFIEGLRGVVSEPVLENPSLWPLIYLPTLLGLSVALVFLILSSRPKRIRREASA